MWRPTRSPLGLWVGAPCPETHKTNVPLLEKSASARWARLYGTRGGATERCGTFWSSSREQNELFAAALTAVLLTGMRRSETVGCEFRESDEYLDVMIPTAKQRTDVPPRRCVSYRKNTPGGRILKRIHERFGMPRADTELSSLLGVGSTTSMPFRNLSVQGLAASVRENRKEDDKGMTLHTLRHLFATDMRRAGWTERELQRAMGHVNPVNTAGYGTE